MLEWWNWAWIFWCWIWLLVSWHGTGSQFGRRRPWYVFVWLLFLVDGFRQQTSRKWLLYLPGPIFVLSGTFFSCLQAFIFTPCINLPNSFVALLSHVYFVFVSLINLLYFYILPVSSQNKWLQILGCQFSYCWLLGILDVRYALGSVVTGWSCGSDGRSV